MEKQTITNDNRVLIIGAPEDGKTTLAMRILKMLHPKKLVIVNPGAEVKFDSIFGPPSIEIDPSFPACQHVTPMVTTDYRKYDSLWLPILAEGRVYTYIDELALVADASRYGMGLKYLYQVGRRRFCGVMAVTQRALEIPRFSFSFSEHIFIGYVEGNDLKRVEEGTRKRITHLVEKRKEHQFIYIYRGHEPVIID